MIILLVLINLNKKFSFRKEQKWILSHIYLKPLKLIKILYFLTRETKKKLANSIDRTYL